MKVKMDQSYQASNKVSNICGHIIFYCQFVTLSHPATQLHNHPTTQPLSHPARQVNLYICIKQESR